MTRIDLTNILADKEARRKEYEEALNSANTAIREKTSPNLDALTEAAKGYSRINEWLTVCELVNETVKNNGGAEVTEEQVKIALCRARNYTKWSFKLNDKTGYLEPKSAQQRINITAMLDKLKVSIDYTAVIAVLGLYLTLAVADNIGDIAKGKIPTCYKLSKLAKQHFEAVNGGDVADPLSKRQSTIAISNALKAFLPESEYKVTNFDWNWFLLVTTKRNKQTTSGVAMVSKSDLEEIFYDYVENLIRNEGTAKFNVSYKVTKKSVSEEDNKEENDNLPDAEFVTSTSAEEKPKTKAKTAKTKAATSKFKEV